MTTRSLLPTVLLLLAGCAQTMVEPPPAPAVPASTPPTAPAAPARTTLVSVMSWYTAIGTLNGVDAWKKDGYRYQGARAGGKPENHRWPEPAGLPDHVAMGSPQYLDLQERAAREDLRLMAEAGFDVALFDMLPWPTWDPAKPVEARNVPLTQFTTFQRWLRAAAGTGMQVGLFPDVANQSGDYPKRRVLNTEEWTRCLSGALKLTEGEPALWRVDGRPGIFHFGTSATTRQTPDPQAPAPDGGWREVLRRLRAGGQDFFFCADLRPHEANREEWDRIADAVHCFAPGGPDAFLAEMQPLLHRRHRVPYLWGTSIGYYSPGLGTWTPPDFSRIAGIYLDALAHDARFVHAMTWNDFAEDTDIAPTWFKGRCLLDVHAFYNRWFKSGREPATWPEHLIVAYPRAIPGTVTAKSVSWGTPEDQRAKHKPDPEDLARFPAWGDWRQPPYHPTLIWWAHLDRPRTVMIPGVGTRILPAGVSMGQFGAIAPGPVQVVIDGAGTGLPPVLSVAHERESGLQYRYHDLLHLDGRERAAPR